MMVMDCIRILTITAVELDAAFLVPCLASSLAVY